MKISSNFIFSMSTTIEELAKQVEAIQEWIQKQEEEKYLPMKDVEGELRQKIQELMEENKRLKEQLQPWYRDVDFQTYIHGRN